MKSEGKKIVVGQKRKKAVKFEDESVFEKENCIKVKNGRIESSEGVLVRASYCSIFYSLVLSKRKIYLKMEALFIACLSFVLWSFSFYLPQFVLFILLFLLLSSLLFVSGFRVFLYCQGKLGENILFI